MASNEIIIHVKAKDDATATFSTIERKAGGLGSVLGGALKLGALGAAAGLAALGSAAALGLSSLIDHEKVTAQTNAALKSTGNAAGVTAKEIIDLANAIEMKSGMDDIAIQTGQNLLLTFTNIKNRAGEGNDIFTQTTKIMADMSVALGQDASSSAVQLGKALHDPIQGVTALRRAGVSFTEAQMEQIRVMQESGDLMGAQKLILQELQVEFGGSAEAAGQTFAGQMAILKASFEDFAAEIMAGTLPALTAAVTYIRAEGIPALEEMKVYIETEFVPTLQEQFALMSESTRAEWSKFMPYYETEIRPALNAIQNRIDDLINWTRENWALIEPIIRIPLDLALVFVNHAVGTLTALFDIVIQLLQGDFSEAWRAFVRLIEAQLNFGIGMVTYFKDTVIALFGGLAAGLVSLGGLFLKAGNDLLERFFAGAMGQAMVMLNWAGTFPAQIWNAMAGAAGILYDRGRQLIQGLVDGMFSVNIPNPLDLIPGLPKLPGIGRPSFPKFHDGGIVPGPIGQERMIIAKGGETVLPTHKGGYGGGVTINVNINAIDGASVQRIAPDIARAIQGHLRLQGSVGMLT